MARTILKIKRASTPNDLKLWAEIKRLGGKVPKSVSTELDQEENK